MALVVFLRGVNVGRHKRFLPAQLAKDLAEFDVVNIGAAGTFVVRKPLAQSRLAAEIAGRLGFDADIIVVKGRELIEFVESGPFGRRPPANDEQQFATVLLKRLSKTPPLPLLVPPGDDWQVKVVAVSGPFVASVWRRQQASRPMYPNAAIEKQIGVATTRNWNTIRAICKILQP
jgi:uncharacterized protein (DUF1697 family)